VDTWSESSYAKRCRIGIIRADIKLGGKPSVLADANELSADFTDHPELVGEVYELAHDCCLLKRYEDARQLWQCVVDNCPGSTDMIVMRSRIGIIKADIKLENHETADAATETILARYSDHKNFPRIICQLGDDYLESGQYEKARGLYQYVINKRPEDQMAILSHAGIGRVKIHFNDDLAAQTIIEYLITNFHDHPRLAQAVVRIGEEYYSRALEYRKQGLESQSKESFAKAISVWERMLRDISVESHTVYPAQAYYFSAISCIYLGQHEKAINYYQAVVDKWPDSEHAPYALFRIGRAYENLRKSGVVSKTEADSKIRSAYEQLLEKYPSCEAAPLAQRWLSHNNSN
jgi:TolA-binding protein